MYNTIIKHNYYTQLIFRAHLDDDHVCSLFSYNI